MIRPVTAAPPGEGFDALLARARGAPALAADLGLRALAERREEDALPVLVAAAGRQPNDARLHHVTGLVHRALGDLASALEALDRALSLAPDAARLVHARAQTAAEAGLDSLPWFARARALAPMEAPLILGHAAALFAAGRQGEGDALLADTLAQHPGWIEGHAALIRLRHMAGAAGRAFEALDRAIAGAPRDPRLHHVRIAALHRARDGEGASAALARARAMAGEQPVFVGQAAMLATEYGRLDEADALFARLDPLADADLAIHWFRHLLRRGAPDRLLALEPRLPASLEAHAEPYLALARRLSGTAAAAWPDDAAPVAVVDFGEDWPLLAPLAETLRALHVAQGQPLDQSVRGGTQTDGPLLSRLDPPIRELRARIMTEVEAYRARLPAGPAGHPFLARAPRRPRIAGSWSVRLADGGYHDPHIHNEGWLSSAFYVALPPDSTDPEAGALVLGEPQPTLGLALPPLRIVRPRRGRLILFPSTAWHGTRAFPEGERLTVAFDIA